MKKTLLPGSSHFSDKEIPPFKMTATKAWFYQVFIPYFTIEKNY